METVKNYLKGEFVFSALVLSIGLIISASLASYTFYKIRTFDNNISVTGSAKLAVVSDSVKWTSNFSRTVTERTMQKGYSDLTKDLLIIKNFLTDKGIKDDELTISPVFTNEVYKYNPSGDAGPREYTLMQTITVQGSDLKKITDLAKNTQGIINEGVLFSTQSPEYYYSKLAELRVSLLADAIKDAKARAEMLAKSGGRGIGPMRSASSGVVQVLAPNSIDVSDYGQYDTQSINKEVMVTVKASFVVN